MEAPTVKRAAAAGTAKVSAGMGAGDGIQSMLVYLFLACSCWIMFEVHVVAPTSTSEGHSGHSGGGGARGGGGKGWLEQVQVQVRPDFDLQGYLTPVALAGFGRCLLLLLAPASC